MCLFYFYSLSYLLGINELSTELHAVKEEEIKAKHRMRKQLQKMNNALVQYNSLKKYVSCSDSIQDMVCS
jgi:hypothetical protein